MGGVQTGATTLDLERLGEYFSALSNEANLKGVPYGWLIFGVQDCPKEIVGSQYRSNRPHLDKLKLEIAAHTSHRMTFEEIFELATPRGRVILFQIPAALRGMPTSWKGHLLGRDGQSLVPLNLHEIEQIRAQAIREDWSAKLGELNCSRISIREQLSSPRCNFKKSIRNSPAKCRLGRMRPF